MPAQLANQSRTISASSAIEFEQGNRERRKTILEFRSADIGFLSLHPNLVGSSLRIHGF